MKKLIALLTIVSICLSVSYTSLAQTIIEEGTFDLQFTNPSLNASEYCVDLQIKSFNSGEEFALGTHTVFVNFNVKSIISPVYTSINFNDSACDIAAYYAPQSGFSNTTGEWNLTTNMALTNLGCPKVNDEWMDMGVVCFQVVNENESVDLAFNKELTLLNKNTDTPQHIMGETTDLDEPPINALSTAIKETVANNNITLLEAIPNPAQNSVQISYQVKDVQQEVIFVLSDISGKELYRQDLTNTTLGKQNILLNISDLVDGIYMYTLSIGNQKMTKKLVISK